MENVYELFSRWPYRGMNLLTMTPLSSFFFNKSHLFRNTGGIVRSCRHRRARGDGERTNDGAVLEQLRAHDGLPEDDRVLQAVDVAVLRELLVEAGYRRQEQDGLDVVEVRQPRVSLDRTSARAEGEHTRGPTVVRAPPTSNIRHSVPRATMPDGSGGRGVIRKKKNESSHSLAV